MTEGQQDQLDVEIDLAQEDAMPVDDEGSEFGEQPVEERKSNWAVAAIIVALLALCTCVFCLAAAYITLSGGEDETPVAPPALAPTKAPGAAMIAITEPDQGQVVDITNPVRVGGKGVGLPEGNIVVEVLDPQGNVLDRQPATLKGSNVASGGEGTWSTDLTVKVEPGTAGKIWAYAPSPKDGSILAEDVVEVSLGKTAAVEAYIQITEPAQGALVDISGPVTVGGNGAGLPEGNVVVEALDRQGNLLDRQPATLQGQDVGAGGEGTWSTELGIEAEPGTAGTIRAYATSPKDGSTIAEDSVEVSLGQTPSVEPYLKIDEPAQGSMVEVSQLVVVSGTGAGLPEGNVVVVALDQDENVLAEEPATLQGPDVGTGGEATWSVELAIPAAGQTPGYLAVFSASPKQRSLVASDHIDVTFSGEYSLEGPTWLLDKTIPGSEITALFDNGQVSGSAGCNTYQGTYNTTLAAGRNSIEFGPLAVTMMMCDDPLMEQEGLYLAAFESANEYVIEGFALSFEYPGGTLLYYDKDGPRPRR